jgi:hypothetical protein
VSRDDRDPRETLRVEIQRLQALGRDFDDEKVVAAIRDLVEELERRIRRIDDGGRTDG